MIKIGLALLFHSHIPTHFWVEAFITTAYIINHLPTPLLEGKSHFQLLYGSSPNYEIFHPFGCRVYPCLRDYMTNKFSPQSILCIFMGYHSSYKGFHCLDPTTSRIYITRHAQFNENHFPFHQTSQAQPISSLQISTFLEPSLPPTDMPLPSPTSNSRHIPQSGSTSRIIFTDPVDKSLQATDSYIGPSPSHSNFRPASPKPITELPMVDRPSIAIAPLGSHPMLTRAKAGIFKTRHPAHLRIVGSYGLLSALLASTEPKGFKSATKNPVWLATMDDEVQALQNNHTLILIPQPTNTNNVGSKWVFQPNIFPTDLLNVSKLFLLPRATHKYLVLTTLTLLALSSRPL